MINTLKQLNLSKVILEDIAHLAEVLSGYQKRFEGKTFLVTGAGGFLGCYITLLLKYLNDRVLAKKLNAVLLDNFVTGYEPEVISDRYLKFRKHNVVESLELEGPVDYILHAAGIASPAYYTKFPIETMDVGTIGTRNMLELARHKKAASFVFFSSSEVYGDPDEHHIPTSETYNGNVSITGPRSFYDESKRFGEAMCMVYWNVFRVPIKIVRPFNVYGPGIRPNDYRVLPNFIEHALKKEPIPIHGDGKNTRTFCYIGDAIEAIFKLLFSEANGEAFNVGNPEPEISMADLAQMVAESMSFKVGVVRIDSPHAVYQASNPKRRCPDIRKLQSVIPYQPRYSLQEGLNRTIKWFSEQ